MTLEDICMPLEEAKAFKEAGGRQDTLFHWVEHYGGYNVVDTHGEWIGTKVAAAPTVGEAMRWMPGTRVFWARGSNCWALVDDEDNPIGRTYSLWSRLIWLQKEGRLAQPERDDD